MVVIRLSTSISASMRMYCMLVDNMAQLNIPDIVFYNWLANYISGHLHCAKHGGLTSPFQEMPAGIIQGSVVGPASYVVSSSDLMAVTAGDALCKYADDTSIIIPSLNVDTGQGELSSVAAWSRPAT